MSTRIFTTTHYRLSCDRCGAIGPRAELQQDALDAALQDGWQRITHYSTRLEVFDFCPPCFAVVDDDELVQEEAHR